MFASFIHLFEVTYVISKPQQSLVFLYEFSFGAIICILNGIWFRPTQELLLKYAYFLHCQDGKAFFFCFIGALMAVEVSWYAILAGVWCFLTGIMCGVMHYKRQRAPEPQVNEVYGQM